MICDECLLKITGECEGDAEPEGLKILKNLLGVNAGAITFHCEDFTPRKGQLDGEYKYSVEVLPGEVEETIYGEEPCQE